MNESAKQDRRNAYMAKLRDPRWQKRRLEIMQRDEFRCQGCMDDESTLNVHHNYYKADCEPWEYPDAALVTLCEECHTEETENRRSEEALLLHVCRVAGFHISGLNGLALAIHALGEHSKFSDHWEYELTWMIAHFWELRDVIEPLMAEDARKRHAARLQREAEAESQTKP